MENASTQLASEPGATLPEPAKRAPGPSIGITEIDGKPATAVRFEKIEKEGASSTYNATFTLDSKTVVKLKGLDAYSLVDAVGEKNARAMQESESGKGTLKGEALNYEYGLSPEEAARRAMEKEERKTAELSGTAVAVDARAMDALAAKRAADSEAVRQEMAQQQREVANAIARSQRDQDKGKGQRLDGGDNEVQSDEVFSTAEDDRLPLVPPDVAAKYIKVGDKYHFQRNPEAVAFQDRGSKLETQTNSPAVADSMVRIALARGWDEIRVTGTEAFKREVWMKAAAQGMHVRGYQPTDADLAKLEAAKQQDFRGREKVNAVEGNRERSREQKMADAFKSDSPEKAMKEYPELASVYATVEIARRKAAADRLSAEEKKIFMDRVNRNAAKSIEQGQVPQIKVSEVQQERKHEVERSERPRREKEIER